MASTLTHSSYITGGARYTERVEAPGGSAVFFGAFDQSAGVLQAPRQENIGWRGCILIVRCTTFTTVLNLVPWLITISPFSGTRMDSLSLAAMTAVGNYTYEIYPGIDTGSVANPHYSHPIPVYHAFELRWGTSSRRVVGDWSCQYLV